MRRILIFCSIILLYYGFRSYLDLKSYVYDFSEMPLDYAYVLFPVILFPIAMFAFWKKWKVGWTLLAIVLCFCLIDELWTFYETYVLKYYERGTVDPGFAMPPPIIPHIICLLLLGLILFDMCKNKIREMFFIDIRKMLITIALTIAVTIFWIIAMYFSSLS